MQDGQVNNNSMDSTRVMQLLSMHDPDFQSFSAKHASQVELYLLEEVSGGLMSKIFMLCLLDWLNFKQVIKLRSISYLPNVCGIRDTYPTHPLMFRDIYILQKR